MTFGIMTDSAVFPYPVSPAVLLISPVQLLQPHQVAGFLCSLMDPSIDLFSCLSCRCFLTSVEPGHQAAHLFWTCFLDGLPGISTCCFSSKFAPASQFTSQFNLVSCRQIANPEMMENCRIFLVTLKL